MSLQLSGAKGWSITELHSFDRLHPLQAPIQKLGQYDHYPTSEKKENDQKVFVITKQNSTLRKRLMHLYHINP